MNILELFKKKKDRKIEEPQELSHSSWLSPDVVKAIRKTKGWVHLAQVYKKKTGEGIVYVNGERIKYTKPKKEKKKVWKKHLTKKEVSKIYRSKE